MVIKKGGVTPSRCSLTVEEFGEEFYEFMRKIGAINDLDEWECFLEENWTTLKRLCLVFRIQLY